MKFKLVLFCCFLLSQTVVAGKDFGNGPYWSVLKTPTFLDTLKNDARRSALDQSTSLKKFLGTVAFRELFKDAGALPTTFPTSSGVYNAGIQSDSLSAFDQQLLLLRNLGDLGAEAEHLSSYGIHYALQGETKKGIGLLEQSVQLRYSLDDKAGLLRNILYLARIHRYQGDADQALRYNRQLMSMSLDMRSNSYLAESYINQAEIMTAQGLYKEAEQLILKKALPLTYYKLKDKPKTIQCFEQLASLYESQKRYSEAKWFYIQANTLARTSRNIPEIITSLIRLAHVKMAIGDAELALRDYREAEDLSKANNYPHKLVEVKAEIAEAYLKLGRNNESETAKAEFIALHDAMVKKI